MESQAASPFRDHADRTADGAEERRRALAEDARGRDDIAHTDHPYHQGQGPNEPDREKGRREDDEYDR